MARDVISGKKIISLAVTEPQAGSDVAGLLTTAERDGGPSLCLWLVWFGLQTRLTARRVVVVVVVWWL